MELASQHQITSPPRIITYALRALVLLFGLAVALSYVYNVLVELRSQTRDASLVVLPMAILVPFALGWLINRKHPGHRIALLFLIMAYSTSIMMIAAAVAQLAEARPGLLSPAMLSVVQVLRHSMYLPGVLFPVALVPLYFPDGKLLSPRWRWLVALCLLLLTYHFIAIALRPWPWPAGGLNATRALNGIAGSEPLFDAATTVFTVLALPVLPLVILCAALRYHRSAGVVRQQMKWPLLALLCMVFSFPLQYIFPAIGALDVASGYLMTWILAMLFPLSVGIAILRHGLWDIDIIISRALIYGGLSAVIVAVYVAVVGVLGLLFQTQTNAMSGLIAAAIIAVLFQPLRERLQRYVNRLVYGESDDPAVVLTRLAQHAQTAESQAAILPSLVETIARVLKIPHAAIWLPAEVEHMEPVAVWGEPTPRTRSLPLVYHQEVIGHLVVGRRAPGDPFNGHEQGLLTTIAALTATTVRAVQLSDELRQSRRRIVAAREEERRRLRRDLHDDLGPQLASQALGLEAVAELMPGQPDKAQALLASLHAQAHEAILDVRRVVYDLRPPALDDLGLVPALRQTAARYDSRALRFTVDVPAPLPELPAAVETAVFRIAQEAMVNVVRHAQATFCTVRLSAADGCLVLEVRDNGRGLAADYRSGVGLQALQERTAELGGQYMLESLPGGGTLVRARLPLEVGV